MSGNLRDEIAKIIGTLPTDEYEAADRVIALFEAQFVDEYGDFEPDADRSLRENLERLAFVVMASPFQMSARRVATQVLRICHVDVEIEQTG